MTILRCIQTCSKSAKIKFSSFLSMSCEINSSHLPLDKCTPSKVTENGTAGWQNGHVPRNDIHSEQREGDCGEKATVAESKVQNW